MSIDFSKQFASGGGKNQISDSNYNLGFDYLGAAPPTVEDFNWLFNLIDQKHLNLFNASRQWLASHAYALGDIIKSSSTNSYKYMECTTAGTSGTLEPAWTATGTTVADGTVIWTVRDINAVNTKAGLASPSFTGVPTAPTATAGTTTTQIATTAFVQSEKAVKAWVNFNGTGTVAIRGSYNVSSITDNGVGDYTINFTTPMADTNYAHHATYSDGTATSYAPLIVRANILAGSIRINQLGSVNGPPTNSDWANCSVTIFR